MEQDRMKLVVQATIAGALILLNIQFFVTFRLSHRVNVDGSVYVSGDVTTTPATGSPYDPAAAPGPEEQAQEDMLRRVLSDCTLSSDIFTDNVAQARSLKLSCLEAPTPPLPPFPMPR